MSSLNENEPNNNELQGDSSGKKHRQDAIRLLSKCKTASLATLEPNGFPYVSHVEIAVSDHAEIFVLMSALAVHTRNVLKDDRVALVVVDPDADWIIATKRATFQGHLRKLEDKPQIIRDLILVSHPDAAQYIDFSDFYFFKLDVDNVRYIKGFGEMSRFKWIEK